jgi:hypothetical protein
MLAFACHGRNRQTTLLVVDYSRWKLFFRHRFQFQISAREFKMSPTSAHACMILVHFYASPCITPATYATGVPVRTGS